MRSNYKKLGSYIREINVRNKNLEVETLLGVSVKKVFIPSIANTVGTDFSKYKIVKKNQFTYIPDTSRRGDKIGVAMLEDYDKALVSQVYTVFEIIDHEQLNPEYLMMWFRRSEFDRYARYKSHGSVREIFDWDEMCEIELPIPHIDKQREIVKEYNTIVDRIKLNEQLNKKLEETAQAVYKHWFVDFEFPVSKEYAAKVGKPEIEGKPYKSSGGEMILNEELGKVIPIGWAVDKLGEICLIRGGKRLPAGESLIVEKTPNPYIKVADLGNNKYTILNQQFEYLTKKAQRQISRYIVEAGDLVISIVGTIGIVRIIHDSLAKANLTENCAKLTAINKVTPDYLLHFFHSPLGRNVLEMGVVGGVQGKLPLYNIASFPIVSPSKGILNNYTTNISKLNKSQQLFMSEAVVLEELRRNLLLKLSKVEGTV